MNIMFNNLPFISGGNLKITDFLEDPVNINTLTNKSLHDLVKDKYTQYCLFGEFYAMLTGKPIRYIGYIPICWNDSIDIYDGNPSAYIYNHSGKYYFGISYPVIENDGSLRQSNIYSMSITSTVTAIDFPIANGRIWIGKYKQQVQE